MWRLRNAGRRAGAGCLTLAIAVRGPVTTIDGLAEPGGTLHSMQQAFIEGDTFQCGYCTPGQILSAIGCVAEGHAGSDAEIREYMSGNSAGARPIRTSSRRSTRPKAKCGAEEMRPFLY